MVLVVLYTRKMRHFLKSMLSCFLEMLVLAASAFVYALAFPNFLNVQGWGFLAFFAWIPVFRVINRATWKTVWFEGMAYGFGFYLVYNYWLKTFHPLAILLAPTLESFQYVLLFLVLKLAGMVGEKRGYLVQSLVFVAYEYLTQQGFLAYPYGNIATAIWAYRPLIQIASIGGVWVICFLMILPQAFLAQKHKEWSGYRVDIGLYLAVVFASLLFGFASIAYYDAKVPKRVVRIAAVQHSADSWKGGYETYKENYETLRGFSLEAMAGNPKPDMVLWSETAFVPSVSWHLAHPTDWRTRALVDDFVNFGKTLGVPLITGNPEGLVKDETLPAVLRDGTWNWKTYNTVILFGQGRILGTYRKQHLVPFTEYFPYEKQFPRLYNLLVANDYKWWEPGTEATVFRYDGIDFSTPICFEDIFGYLSAGFVKNGADMLVNLTNDSWSGSVCAEMQHMSQAVFRAIENRRPLIRGTNSGMTTMVDVTGRPCQTMEPFTKGWRLYEVPLGQKEGTTFYTLLPDFFGKLLLVLAVCALAGYGRSFFLVWSERRRCWKRWGHLFDALDEEMYE